MALPESAPKVNCTLSKPLMADGTVGVITSAFLKIDKDLVWTDTGETIYKESVPTLSIDDTDPGTVSFEVIPVDVDGMHDAAGNGIKNWVYTLRVELELANSVNRSVDYVFQPTLEDGDVDLDLVPHRGVVSEPPIAFPPVPQAPLFIHGGRP